MSKLMYDQPDRPANAGLSSFFYARFASLAIVYILPSSKRWRTATQRWTDQRRFPTTGRQRIASTTVSLHRPDAGMVASGHGWLAAGTISNPEGLDGDSHTMALPRKRVLTAARKLRPAWKRPMAAISVHLHILFRLLCIIFGYVAYAQHHRRVPVLKELFILQDDS
ncbi:hypothetical protein Y032_0270g882 [Ancylostoma ceylanicum]|uniref:Uncharacterized protein n=1 Tax=Ancylostoma ceylanicum TaxID=53326 RepID=A0A016S8P8_9BILA|nr:hypothetical protein Y032_0270g882 [Ancylostoma ceylanicum]